MKSSAEKSAAPEPSHRYYHLRSHNPQTPEASLNDEKPPQASSSLQLATVPATDSSSSSTTPSSLNALTLEHTTKSSASQINKMSSRAISPLKNFTCFPKLPIELQCKIWRYTHEPRAVVIDGDRNASIAYTSATKIPVALHACVLSRTEAKKFYELNFSYRGHPNDRRIWFDASMDMLHIRKVPSWGDLTFILNFMQGPSGLQSISCDVMDDGHHCWFACAKPSFDAIVARGLKGLAADSDLKAGAIKDLVTNISMDTLLDAGFKKTSRVYADAMWDPSWRNLEKAVGISDRKWRVVRSDWNAQEE